MIDGYLCEINITSLHELIIEPFEKSPDILTKLMFRLVHGIRGYKQLWRIRGSEKSDEVKFYSCKNRRNQDVYFVYAMEHKGDGGGSFIVENEDYHRVKQQLENLYSKEKSTLLEKLFIS